MRRTSALATGLIALVAVAAQTGGGPNAPTFDHVGGGNVVPPGNSGHIPSTQLLQALNGGFPDNMTDQRDLYVDWGRKDWPLLDPDAPSPEGSDERDAIVGEPISPMEGVVIYRDGWGVPHVYGETDAATQFGVGYALAQDRLFQADVFRHVARGEMAEFLGGQEWYDYDREWRREFYTDDELVAMFEESYTAEQRDLVQAYLDGINLYIAEALEDPEKLPAEYLALQIVPEPWEPRHALAIFVLQARDSVEGFGEELQNTALLADLVDRLGHREGRAAFEDIRFYRDAGAYTSAPSDAGRFPYPGGGFEGLDATGVALPDDPAAVEALAQRDAMITKALTGVGLGRKQASNAVAVSDEFTADGTTMLLGGPQLEYLVPGIFWEFEAHSPTQHVRGIGFAGTAGVVLIGKTPTHAWSITYGYTDQIDVFLVPLDPADPDASYLRDGASHPIDSYTTTVTCKTYVAGLVSPSADDTCDGLPVGQETVTVERIPEYGPIIGRVDVGGEPHAVVKVRAHWMKEISNGRPFVAFNQPSTMVAFREAQADFTISLNINYADDQGHAGFWHVARPPIRAEGTDVRLPTIGNGDFDWQGFVPLDDIPHAIDPAQGFTANWNNQIGEGWHNGDENYWGDVQRVDILARRMEALAERGDITPEDLWAVNRLAATEDVRVHDFRPLLEAAFPQPPDGDVAAAALDAVLAWDGQRTASLEGDVWLYDATAVAVWDRLFEHLNEVVLADELDAYFTTLSPDFEPDSYYLYLPLLLKALLGDDAPLPPGHDWLNGASRDQVIVDAFEAAVAELEADLGSDVSGWRVPAALTTYRAVGLGSVEPHPFLNRGTYNQLAVIEQPREPVPSPSPSPSVYLPPPGQITSPPASPTAAPAATTNPPAAPLPTTGGGFVVAGLVAALALASRRRAKR